MRSTRLARAKDEAQELQPPGLDTNADDTQILADLSDLAEISRENQEHVTRQVTAARRLALEQLQERYGHGVVSERVFRAYGLGRAKKAGGRRARALRERVRMAAEGFALAGVPFGDQVLGAAVGATGPADIRRVRQAVAQLIRAGKWPARSIARAQSGGSGA